MQNKRYLEINTIIRNQIDSSTSFGVHSLRMTTTSSSLNVGFTVAEEANASEALSATKCALMNKILNLAEHSSMLESATASENCSSIVFSVKA